MVAAAQIVCLSWLWRMAAYECSEPCLVKEGMNKFKEQRHGFIGPLRMYLGCEYCGLGVIRVAQKGTVHALLSEVITEQEIKKEISP